MDELLKFSDCKFIRPVGLTGAKYDQRKVLNESSSVYFKLQRDVLHELELEVYEKGTQSGNSRKTQPYMRSDKLLRAKYGKTLGCVALTRKQSHVPRNTKADKHFLKAHKAISRPIMLEQSVKPKTIADEHFYTYSNNLDITKLISHNIVNF